MTDFEGALMTILVPSTSPPPPTLFCPIYSAHPQAGRGGRGNRFLPVTGGAEEPSPAFCRLPGVRQCPHFANLASLDISQGRICPLPPSHSLAALCAFPEQPQERLVEIQVNPCPHPKGEDEGTPGDSPGRPGKRKGEEPGSPLGSPKYPRGQQGQHQWLLFVTG